jgi:hypothetical protein
MRLFAPFSCSKVKEQFLFKSDIHVYIYTYICPFAPFSCSKVKKKVSKTSKSTQHSLKVKAKKKTDTSKSTRNKAQETKKTKTSNLNKALDCDHGADAGKKRKKWEKRMYLAIKGHSDLCVTHGAGAEEVQGPLTVSREGVVLGFRFRV